MKLIPITVATLLGSLLLAGCGSGPDVPVLTPNTVFDLAGDKMFEYRAPTDGFIHVYDVNQDKSLFDGSIKKNEVLSIDPREKTLSIGGKMAPDNLKMPTGNTLQIQFRAMPTPEQP